MYKVLKLITSLSFSFLQSIDTGEQKGGISKIPREEWSGEWSEGN